ncbi:MAG: bifunctional folylpolyglutamate synthase/dihydrofolate synthase [Anaerolineales bacterium]|nr:bifunctional folylpolyglutamate synthase/dihydrofolate synthase [Anaerolineales bacterium]
MKTQDTHDARFSDAYEEALDHLYATIDLEQKRLDRYAANKLDQTRPKRLMAALQAPHDQFPSIHIAGTKGKGSVAAMCAAAFRAAGLKVGLYTSPHMVDFRERVRILTPTDSEGLIDKAAFVRMMRRIRAVEAEVPGITWFEMITAIAFLYFAEQAVDVAVVEVGLGGRLDATNVLTPLVSVITSLSLDHTYFLGNTLAEIAYEKGGIIKPGVPVVTASQVPEALARLQQIAQERHAPLCVIGRDYVYEPLAHGPHGQEIEITRPQHAPIRLHVALAGAHQQENGTVALAALHTVQPHFPALTDEAIAAGMTGVSWHGRLEILHEAPDTPTVLVDCAHNEDSAEKLRQALLDEYQYERLHLIFGVSADKDIGGMMHHLFSITKHVIATQSTHPRAITSAELAQLAGELGYTVETAVDVETAVRHAWATAGPHDLICITGSIFIVGDLLNQWDSLQSQLIQTGQGNHDEATIAQE